MGTRFVEVEDHEEQRRLDACGLLWGKDRHTGELRYLAPIRRPNTVRWFHRKLFEYGYLEET